MRKTIGESWVGVDFNPGGKTENGSALVFSTHPRMGIVFSGSLLSLHNRVTWGGPKVKMRESDLDMGQC